MLTKTKGLSKFLLTGALLSSLFTANAFAGETFLTINPSHPSGTPNKTEVLEFFSYGCGHCAAMDPMLEKWAPTLPKNVAFVRVPVAFNAAMEPLQKIYYTLEALGRLDLHSKVFDAIHQKSSKQSIKDAFISWAVEQGLNKDEVLATFDSFGIDVKIKRARDLTDQYKIDSTPSFVIGGKYLTSPSMTGSYESAITQSQALLDNVLAESKK